MTNRKKKNENQNFKNRNKLYRLQYVTLIRMEINC